MKFRFFLSVLLLVFQSGLNAQPVQVNYPYLKFDRLTKKDGLSANRILDIFQDSHGFIWLGTLKGLNKFDGYRFENYLPNDEDTLSVSGEVITAIEEDIFGNFWIGTNRGLDRYNRKENNFEQS